MAPDGRNVPVDVLLDAGLADVPDAVRHLTAAGADGLFTFEGPRDPFLPLAVAATQDSDALLYTNLAIALPRSPMHLAQQAWDLQRAAGGRFVLGLGTQVRRHVEQRYGTRWESPVEQMREWLLALRAIMTSWQDRVPLAFEGQWTRHTYLPPFLDPGPRPPAPPPVVVGAVGPRMLRMAAETADGLLIHPFCSPLTLEVHTMPAIADGLETARRERREFLVVGQAMVAVGLDDASSRDALRRARAQVGFYASTPAYRVMLDVHGWGGLQPHLQELVRAGKWGEIEKAVPDEVVDAFVCSGTPVAAREQLLG